jgi:hypothetical protein
MEFKQTKHQVARGSRPDADTFDKFYLIKGASELRATYQIRLLIYMAVEQGKELIIEVRKDCKIHESLRELAKQYSKSVRIERKRWVSI